MRTDEIRRVLVHGRQREWGTWDRNWDQTLDLHVTGGFLRERTGTKPGTEPWTSVPSMVRHEGADHPDGELCRASRRQRCRSCRAAAPYQTAEVPILDHLGPSSDVLRPWGRLRTRRSLYSLTTGGTSIHPIGLAMSRRSKSRGPVGSRHRRSKPSARPGSARSLITHPKFLAGPRFGPSSGPRSRAHCAGHDRRQAPPSHTPDRQSAYRPGRDAPAAGLRASGVRPAASPTSTPTSRPLSPNYRKS